MVGKNTVIILLFLEYKVKNPSWLYVLEPFHCLRKKSTLLKMDCSFICYLFSANPSFIYQIFPHCLQYSNTVHAEQLQSRPTLCDPRDSPGKNAGVGCHALLQGIFLTQELNLHLLYLFHWVLYL